MRTKELGTSWPRHRSAPAMLVSDSLGCCLAAPGDHEGVARVACVEIFTDRLTDIMNVIEKEHKLCYIMGYLNIDFLKSDDHKSTGALLDVLHSYNVHVFPLITKPTRVTEKTATLIDHIWTNNFDVDTNHIQGIFCTSMTDHYAIFHIAGNISHDDIVKDLPNLRRDIGQKNIKKMHWWNENH